MVRPVCDEDNLFLLSLLLLYYILVFLYFNSTKIKSTESLHIWTCIKYITIFILMASHKLCNFATNNKIGKIESRCAVGTRPSWPNIVMSDGNAALVL